MNKTYANALDEILNEIRATDGTTNYMPTNVVLQRLIINNHIEQAEADLILKELIDNNLIFHDDKVMGLRITFKGYDLLRSGGYRRVRQKENRKYWHKVFIDYSLAIAAVVAIIYYTVQLVNPPNLPHNYEEQPNTHCSKSR